VDRRPDGVTLDRYLPVAAEAMDLATDIVRRQGRVPSRPRAIVTWSPMSTIGRATGTTF
jgi:hypothetical protein